MKRFRNQKYFKGMSGRSYCLTKASDELAAEEVPGIFFVSISCQMAGIGSLVVAYQIQYASHTENLSRVAKQLADHARQFPGASCEFCFLAVQEQDLRETWGLDLALSYSRPTAA